MVLAIVLTIPMLAIAAHPGGGGRLRPPDFVTCDRNVLTSFTGEVTGLERGEKQTRLQLKTDEETRESITLRHETRSDLTRLFHVSGEAFRDADWVLVLEGERLRDGARATVWVCSDQPNPQVDWQRPPD